MTEHIKDYRYDRTQDPKETMDHLYGRDDLWMLTDALLVTTHVLDLSGQDYTGRAQVSKKDLVNRHYVLYWDLSGEFGILWLDEVMLASNDPRGGSSRANPIGTSSVAHISKLTVTERDWFKQRVRKHRIGTHPEWADPVQVLPVGWTPDIPPPSSIARRS